MGDKLNYKNLVSSVEKVIIEASGILLSYFRKDIERINKTNKQGFVTEADTATEAFLIDKLTQIFPQASIYAEESGHSGVSNQEYCWVIDPLDGTTNFAYGIPYFCISIALTHKNIPVLAVVYEPITNELFSAINGQGAYLNGKRIQVSQIDSLHNALLLLSAPYVKDNDYERLLKISNIIDQKSYVRRQLGSVVLDAAYVACGRADGYYFNKLAWWDLAAGMLLIQEAGGIVTEFDGSIIMPDYKTCVGANPPIYKELKVALLKY